MTTVDLGLPTVAAISNSEIQVWMDCRRRWWLTFVREMSLREENVPITGALSFGSRIHLCLERMYVNGEDPIAVFEELYSKVVYDILTHEAMSGMTNGEIRKKAQNERELAHAMLSGYVAWVSENGVDEGLVLAGAEVVVEVAFDVPGVRLRGKLDQRVWREIDGAHLFRDFKTAANLTDGPKLLPIDEQMKFYMMLERLDAIARNGTLPPEAARGGLYLMLKKNKHTARAAPPFYAQVEVHHNGLDIESMQLRTKRRTEEMMEARREMEAGGDHRYWVYPRPSRECSWKCPFLALCPMMDDSKPETWEAMLEGLYEHSDPYERYLEEDSKA